MTSANPISNTRLAPLPLMATGTALALLLVLLATLISMNMSWLGLRFDVTDTSAGLNIARVNPAGPSAGHLSPGDRITALENASGDRVSLIGFDPYYEPHGEPGFAGYNAYIAFQGRVHRVLTGDGLWLEVDGERRVAMQPESDRPLHALGRDFWLFNFFGLVAWVVGLAVWAFRRDQLAARLLCLSGLGFFLATLVNSIYLSRELAIDPWHFHFLSRANHVALTVMLGSLLALLAYYPRSLSRRSPGPLMLVLLFLYQLNENLQWFEWPLHTFYFPIMLLYIAGLIVAFYQWRLSRHQPLDRAALKWVLLSIFIIMGMGLLIYFVPIALIGRELFSQTAMVGIATLLYVGFAFGVIRYRLFDLERWWLRIWTWFLGGLAVLAFDLMLMYLLGMQPAVALGVAVIAAGWVYFPLRQWLWERALRDRKPEPENIFAAAVEMMSAVSGSEAANQQWRRLLEKLMDPMSVKVLRAPQDESELQESGAALLVPSLNGRTALQLEYAHKGRRLFNQDDLAAVDSLLNVCRHIISVRRAEQHGARLERARIMRDLHDDVGGHILTLLRNAPDERSETLARNALKALREAMQAMDDDKLHRIDDALEEWQAEAIERCQQMGFDIDWSQNLAGDGIRRLSPRQYINIKRILGEGLTNAFKYAADARIKVVFELVDDRLNLNMSNTVEADMPDDVPPRAGRGLHHIRTRIEELHGRYEFSRDGGVARLSASVPLSMHDVTAEIRALPGLAAG